MSSLRRFGILNIDKPAGITSRRAVDHVARFVRPEKAGHAGTLDPLATGVLVICVGKATRLIELIQERPKSYHATFLLGRQSDTDDVTGTVTEVPVSREITREEIASRLPAFVGCIEQVPPSFSAVHVDGRRAHERARAGQSVELAPRTVEVFRLDITRFSYPELELDIDCGSGTYVRSIGRDLGHTLGCGAVMSALVRTRVGPYRIEKAVPLDQLTDATLDAALLDPMTSAAGLPNRVANAEETALVQAGRAIAIGDLIKAREGACVVIVDGAGALSSLARLDASTNSLRPYRVFVD
ncbi:MAG TPA: tRNA pseudouridine(55) synthase TruB [Planctomycetaceae bacterium]|jgi:tRNA pseudouridine55 synthase|nr:tRNA pseudouridine(55) synthase TruB [Planctomycetaceae bacterium]